ncbi:MAG: methionyl-tRNA formyltransferase [Candidatus Moraniibacteriota bacterium]
MSETKKPSIVFMGTPDIASLVLETLLAENYPICAVVTQPDYLSKNGKEVVLSPVKKIATEKNIPLLQPIKLDLDFEKKIEEFKPDLIIVVAFGKIIPEKILKIPRYKSINVHASLLPKLRGSSPIQNALIEGLEQSGITIMLMDKGVDTGDILAQKIIPIDPHDDYLTLGGKMAVNAAHLLISTITEWTAGTLKPTPQDNSQATLCQLIEKNDGKISWDQDAKDIYNKLRAFRVWPGIFTFWENKGNLQKISLNEIVAQNNILEKRYHLGEVFKTDNLVGVQTNDGIIVLKKIQLAGKNEVTIEDFLNGYPNFIGSILK